MIDQEQLEQRRWEVYSSVIANTGVTLRYSAEAETASYDIEKKEVVLPIWDCLDENATQALASHEIGHAKHSTFEVDVFKELVERYGDLFNVVEDARIERLMKNEFRGLVGIFKDGYRMLADKNIFPLDGIEDAPLVERLNAFAKFGFMKSIPFKKEESAFSYRLLNLSTKTDVVDLCEDILEYIGKQEAQKQSRKGSFVESSDGGCSDSVDCQFEDKDDNGEQQEQDANTNGDANCRFSSSMQRELTDQRMRQMERTISADARQSIANNLKDHWQETVVLFPDKIYSNSVAPIEFAQLKNWRFVPAKGKRRVLANVVEKAAQAAASMFNQKQSAEMNANRRKRTIGRIDSKRLAQYGISDALFKQAEKVAKGKSHSVVLLLDYSISMGEEEGVLSCACIQAAILARFCQMIQVPFSVYLFGCGICISWDNWSSYQILKIASEEWLDVDFILALGFVKKHNERSKMCIPCGNDNYVVVPGNNTPLMEAFIAAREEILKMKGMGIEKPVVFVATDGAYNDFVKDGPIYSDTVNVGLARRIIIDGKSCSVDDFKDANKDRLRVTGNLALELLAKFMKKETGCGIVYSSIARKERFGMNAYYWRQAKESFLVNPSSTEFWSVKNMVEPYLYKHSFVFDESIPSRIEESIKSKAFAKATLKKDSIFDLFLTMNATVLKEIENGSSKIESINDSDSILAWLKASNELLQAYRGLVNAFVEFFA